ncbi:MULTISPECIES: FUSC family membrane protein [unclassified Sphingobacterium]|uniref:FUSC family protein n=1 Tax=unclassified Sphingobacterium TaxID=2609468 RepID=UPI00265CA79D|nr:MULTISPECIES: FUSC family membrane protein [unclassified Sphingobacterium]WKK57271.1 FUSC family membrane protein [Sphingobacterium sp. BN32]
MKKTKEISNFFYSQYFADGLRITIGCVVPIIISAAFGEFLMGTFISLGALLIGLSDTPGAPSHRRTGMISCLIVCILTQLITVASNSNIWIMTLVIGLLCFLYSMFAVFNARAATVGSMGILIMLINVDDAYTFKDEMYFLLFFIIGAVWYMLISFSLSQVRPYRLAQQELSESIRFVGDFIRLRANFYDHKVDLDDNYRKLIEKQIEVHEHQENVRDLLFQSKRSIKDTTKVGRFLTLIFNDIVDLFEQSMTTHYDYEVIRKTYSHTGILKEFRNLLLKIANELDHLAYQLNANRAPKPLYNFQDDIDSIKELIDEVEQKENINSIPLKKILISIRSITIFIHNIYNYNAIRSNSVNKQEIDEANKFIQTEHIVWSKLRDNLSFNSSIFRHALRMAVVMAVTYLVLSMNWFNVGSMGSYWVLLTIMVILKPGFGLTKERNFQRLLGTVIGGIIGAIILMTVHNEIALFILLIFFFLTAYSLFRVNYIVAVLFMTPYVLIMLSFTGHNTFEIAKERIFDTFLGGMIAFISSYVVFPNWESFQIRPNMRQLLIANYNYLAIAVRLLSDETVNITEYKLSRKEVYIASANMGSTFQRMLSEPKWRQKSTKEVNRFVILNHILSSYGATLLTQLQQAMNANYTKEHLLLLKKILNNLAKSIVLLTDDQDQPEFVEVSDFPDVTEETLDPTESKLITEQLQFLNKISADLHKSTVDVMEKEALIQPQKIEMING